MPHRIQRVKCAVCGACETVCPTGSIAIDASNQFYRIDPTTCSDCAACVEMCPTEAIGAANGDDPAQGD
jgi:formate hydrogenlyase subunit 6/NADH:ubiquinone oxidoreductase subunit I